MIRRVALAFAVTFLCAVAAEVVLRGLAAPAPAVEEGMRALHELQLDRPWLYGLRPGARAVLDLSNGEGEGGEVLYEVNADGFRDRPVARPKPPGTKRIVVLGDSVVFGYGVPLEQSVTEQLEARLGSGFEVLNFGVTGYNTYTETEQFLARGAAYEPDVVLLGFFTNDLNDPTVHFNTQTRVHFGALPDEAFPDPEARRQPGSWQRVVLPWCRRSQLCTRIDDAILARLAPPTHEDWVVSMQSPDALGEGPERIWLARQLSRLDEAVRAQGAHFAVVTFPFRGQVDSPTAGGLHREVAALGARGGWPTIDLLPAFRRARTQGPLFVDLWHPNARGHSVAAEALAQALARLGWLS